MEDLVKVESAFQIENIVMMKCTLNRINSVTFDQDKIQSSTEVNVNVNIVSPDTSVVTETVIYKHVHKETNDEEVRMEIVMAGIFKRLAESEISLDTFSNIHAPAIMFPYVREHVTILGLKSGIGAVFIAPVDFTKLVKANNNTH